MIVAISPLLVTMPPGTMPVKSIRPLELENPGGASQTPIIDFPPEGDMTVNLSVGNLMCASTALMLSFKVSINKDTSKVEPAKNEPLDGDRKSVAFC